MNKQELPLYMWPVRLDKLYPKNTVPVLPTKQNRESQELGLIWLFFEYYKLKT